MEHRLLTLAWQWLINCMLIETESLSDDSIQLHVKWIQWSKHYCCDENLSGIDLWTDLEGFNDFISSSERGTLWEHMEVAVLWAKQIILFCSPLNCFNYCPVCSLSRTCVRQICSGKLRSEEETGKNWESGLNSVISVAENVEFLISQWIEQS